ncbi:MAG: (Fe-S)-binding protein [Thaumarchaeota archaeon]|nr:(Fe-S)-binding protein [Candidatus Calditenuaceae archaeon]
MSLRELLDEEGLMAERCVRCGFCNSVCPTSLVSSAYKPSRTSRGRMVLIQSALEGAIPEVFDEELAELMDLCFGCNRCVKVCPAGIPIPDVVRRYREAYHSAVGVRGEEMLALRYHRYAVTLSKVPRPVTGVLRSKIGRLFLERAFGISRDAPLPLPEGGNLDDKLRDIRPPRWTRRFAFFPDTFYRYVKPSAALRLADLLSRHQISLSLPPQTDSGILLYEYGFYDRLREVTRINVLSLIERVREGEQVLTCSPAATLMLRFVYPRVLATREAEVLAENVVDINELLLELVESGSRPPEPQVGEVTLHSSCLSQFLGLTEKIARALRASGASLRDLRSDCCGMGGVWGIYAKRRAVAVELCDRLVSGLRGHLVTYSETCASHIQSVYAGPVVSSFEFFV